MSLLRVWNRFETCLKPHRKGKGKAEPIIQKLFPERRTYMHTYLHRIVRYMHAYRLTYIHTYIRTYVRTYVHADIHTYVRTYLPTYLPTYIHTYIHTHIHYILTYTHTERGREGWANHACYFSKMQPKTWFVFGCVCVYQCSFCM